MSGSFVLAAILLLGQAAAQIDITSPGDVILGVPNDSDWPGGESPNLAIDDDTSTKYLHFKGETQSTGFQVTPSAGATVVTGLTLTTANDAVERDPVAFELSGSNTGIEGPYTVIAGGDIADFAGETAWPRFTRNVTPIAFANTKAYSHYQLLFTAVRDPAGANSMQIAEVELLGSLAGAAPADDGDGQTQPQSSGTLVISEFMAINETSLAATVQGETAYPDWIEIRNVSNNPVNLAGWYLTDDPLEPTKWTFPAVQLPAMGFLVVFASGVDQADHPENWPYRDTKGFYHTNFTLDGDGEYLALIAPDLTVAHEYASYTGQGDTAGYPPQRADLSYGLYGDQEQYFTPSTPGRANAAGCTGISEEPVFSRESGTFTGYFMLELTSPSPTAKIHWTLDGQIPTVDSPEYTGPLPIAGTKEVLARAFEPGKAPSAVVSRTYIALAGDVLSFSSNLPIVIVDSSRQGIGGSFSRVSSIVIEVPEQGRTKLTDPANFAGRVGFKKRGRSTGGQAKSQYGFEVWDENNRDKDVSILGMPADSDWVLYAPFTYDRALIINAFIYDLSNRIGRYAVRTRFVEAYINTNDDTVSSSDYAGLYIFMEKIKRGEDRVDIEKLEPWDSTEPRISGGYMIKNDSPDPGDGGFRTARGNPTYGDGTFCYVDPKESEITTAQSAWIRGYLNDFETALYGANFANPQTGYAKYIDVDSFIDHNLLNMLAMNVDALRLSTYMYKPRGGRLGMGPIWDFDRSLNSADGRDDNPRAWNGTGDGTKYLQYVWWDRLFADSNFMQKYIDRWFALRKAQFSTAGLNAAIDSMADEVREAAPRNYQKWPSAGSRYTNFQGEINSLKQWLQSRCEWVDSQFVKPPQIVPAGGHVATGTTVTLVNPYPTGTLYYTLDGTDPRPSNTVTTTRESTTLVAENAAKRAFVPTAAISDAWRGGADFDDSAWISGTGGVGIERQSGYQQYFGIDLTDLMYGKNATCYIRIPFTVLADPATFNFMTLRMRYDDAFIVYLNGVEIRRALFDGTPAWNSVAGGSHNDGDAVIFEDFDVSTQAGLLKKGQNILAIHGMNAGASSSDLLFNAELIAGRSTSTVEGDVPGAIYQYAGPISITGSMQVKARVLVPGNTYSPWSGLAEATFAVGPVAENLRISELMYHPADPNTEFVELTNIGDESINLNLVKFTNGVEFTFPGFKLAPAAYVLVVEDPNAFEARYGPGLPVVGTYAGNLSNSGEQIEIQDAAGQVIQSFRFKDGWYDTTDGGGFSLTVKDPAAADPNAVTQKTAWRPSTAEGGSPGSNDVQK